MVVLVFEVLGRLVLVAAVKTRERALMDVLVHCASCHRQRQRVIPLVPVLSELKLD